MRIFHKLKQVTIIANKGSSQTTNPEKLLKMDIISILIFSHERLDCLRSKTCHLIENSPAPRAERTVKINGDAVPETILVE